MPAAPGLIPPRWRKGGQAAGRTMHSGKLAPHVLASGLTAFPAAGLVVCRRRDLDSIWMRPGGRSMVTAER